MSAEEYTIAAGFHAFAMPSGAPDGGPGVHMTLRKQGLIIELVAPLKEALKAHARLGSAIATFDVARALTGECDAERRVPDGNPATREQERLYRAKLAVRLGLSGGDIRTVFDLTEAELELLRAEVGAA
jgi:hypothetical protein